MSTAEVSHHPEDESYISKSQFLRDEAANDPDLIQLIEDREARLDKLAKNGLPGEEQMNGLRAVMTAVDDRKRELGLLPPEK